MSKEGVVAQEAPPAATSDFQARSMQDQSRLCPSIFSIRCVCLALKLDLACSVTLMSPRGAVPGLSLNKAARGGQTFTSQARKRYTKALSETFLRLWLLVS